MYNGLLAAIPDVWKRSISNSEQQPIDGFSICFTPAVTAKNPHQILVLRAMKPQTIETTLYK